VSSIHTLIRHAISAQCILTFHLIAIGIRVTHLVDYDGRYVDVGDILEALVVQRRTELCVVGSTKEANRLDRY
jgi:hypothetical protein